MGAAKVGKSAIINQFLYNTFTPKYKRTVEEMHHGDFNVSGIQLTLDILDTSGSYEFPAMRDLSIKSADAFILVYDVHDANTFLEVKTLRAQILNTKGAVPIVVVGNKVDLIDTEKQVNFFQKEGVNANCSRICNREKLLLFRTTCFERRVSFLNQSVLALYLKMCFHLFRILSKLLDITENDQPCLLKIAHSLQSLDLESQN